MSLPDPVIETNLRRPDGEDTKYYIYEHFTPTGVFFVNIGQGGMAWNPVMHEHDKWMIDCIHSNRPFCNILITRIKKFNTAKKKIKDYASQHELTYELKKEFDMAPGIPTTGIKCVLTPYGRFLSCSDAARQIGMNYQTINLRCRNKNFREWHFVK